MRISHKEQAFSGIHPFEGVGVVNVRVNMYYHVDMENQKGLVTGKPMLNPKPGKPKMTSTNVYTLKDKNHLPELGQK
jgi:hypothetical protein